MIPQSPTPSGFFHTLVLDSEVSHLDDCYETEETTPIDSANQVYYAHLPMGSGNANLHDVLALRATGVAMSLEEPEPDLPLPGDSLGGSGLSGFPKFTFFIYDHLGNSRILYTNDLVDCNPDSTKYLIEHALDYYPFSKTLREYIYVRERHQTTYHERDEETGLDYRGARFYDSEVGRFLSVEPKAREYAAWSTYMYSFGNPIRFIDPDGRMAVDVMPPDDYIFNEKGDYVRTDKNNKPDKIVIENSSTGKVEGTYNFADPSDAKAIDAGTINKVVFVGLDRIGKMLGEAGAFDKTNRENEWSYMNTESKGGGKLDFSYSAIPSEFAGASADPLTTPSPMLFLPEGDGNAHNHMNFGNFLWGSAGHSLGFSKTTLKAAAQYNSLFNSGTNGYPSQWDSSDDQFSIGRGVDFSIRNQFRNRTWSPTTGLSIPIKKR